MKPLKKETIDQAVKQLRERFSFENLTKRPKFSRISPEKHQELLNFIESMCLTLLDSYNSYIRRNKPIKDHE